MTAEDAATVDEREAERRELRQLRALYAAAQDEIASFRQREDALASELAEAHDWQAATAEILRIIASPRSELSHVLEAMAERAYRLCGATSARVYLIDGDVLRSVTSVAESDLALGDAAPVAVPGYTARLSRQNMVGRAVLDGRVVHIEDADRPDVRRNFRPPRSGPAFRARGSTSRSGGMGPRSACSPSLG